MSTLFLSASRFKASCSLFPSKSKIAIISYQKVWRSFSSKPLDAFYFWLQAIKKVQFNTCESTLLVVNKNKQVLASVVSMVAICSETEYFMNKYKTYFKKKETTCIWYHDSCFVSEINWLLAKGGAVVGTGPSQWGHRLDIQPCGLLWTIHMLPVQPNFFRDLFQTHWLVKSSLKCVITLQPWSQAQARWVKRQRWLKSEADQRILRLKTCSSGVFFFF